MIYKEAEIQQKGDKRKVPLKFTILFIISIINLVIITIIIIAGMGWPIYFLWGTLVFSLLSTGSYLYIYDAPVGDNLNFLAVFIIIFVILAPIGSVWLYCSASGGVVLKSVDFAIDSESVIHRGILPHLYYDLDEDSQTNVTNETYSLKLSIPLLDYSIQFNYLFNFSSERFNTNLTLKEYEDVPKITSLEADEYPLSIEFKINSTDPDILNVSLFPPDNKISGSMHTTGYHGWGFWFELDEGDVDYDSTPPVVLVLPYNQRINGISEWEHVCALKW